MRIVIAPDKFKGTLTAREAADAMALAVRDRWPGAEIAIVPMADGGDGTLDALGGANVHDEVTGPLGAPVRAAWRLDGRAAVIESAAASGLVLAGGAEANDPWGRRHAASASSSGSPSTRGRSASWWAPAASPRPTADARRSRRSATTCHSLPGR